MSAKNGIPLADWMADRDRSVVERIQTSDPSRKPLTKNHLLYQQSIEQYPVTIAVGPAGTGKSVLACGVAAKLLRAGTIKQIVLTRPLVTCGSILGPVPGDEREKMAPYVAALEKALKPMFPPGAYDRMIFDEVIQIKSLETMRGATYSQAFVILDEAQNANHSQIKMFLTRQGAQSHFVVNGDVTQADINAGPDNPLDLTMRQLARLPGVKFVRFTRKDCLRPWLVQQIDERMSRPPSA